MKNIMDKTKLFFVQNKVTLLIILFNFICLYDIIESARLHDDVVYYYLKGGMINTGQSLIDIITNSFWGWFNAGRFFPLSLHSFIVYYIVSGNDSLYKCLIVVFTCINIWQLGDFVELIWKNKKIKYYSMITISIFFQVYVTYHNALIGYHLFMQLMTILLFLIFKNLYKYFDEKKKKYLYYVVLFCLMSMLTYEIGFVYTGACIIICLVRKETIRLKLKEIFLIGVPAGVLGLINVAIKIMYSSGYSGINVSLDLVAVIKTWIKQCFAAIPLSHTITQYGNGMIPSNISGYISNIDLHIGIAIGLCIGLLWITHKQKDMNKIVLKNNSICFFFGFCIIYLGIGFLIALTTKYQSELQLGIAHIPVYIQYFLLAMIFIWSTIYVFNKLSNKYIRSVLKIFSMFLIMVCVFFNMVNTKCYVIQSNNIIKYPQQIIINAMKDGLFEEIPENSNIVVGNTYLWNNMDFFAEYTNKTYNIISWEQFMDEAIDTDVYLLEYSAEEKLGLVKLGKVDEVIKDGKHYEVMTSSALIYTQYAPARDIIVKGEDNYVETYSLDKLENQGNISLYHNDYKNVMIKYENELNDIFFDEICVVYGK